MIAMAKRNTLEICRIVGIGAYLGDLESRVFLPAKYLPKGAAVGDRLEVFVYTDTHDKPVATTETPYGLDGDFAAMTVVDIVRHGVYLDWGLDKDLLVPELEIDKPLEEGDTVVVAVYVDHRSNRPVASARIGRYFDYEPWQVEEGQQVKALVYGFIDAGAQVVVDNRYRGLIYADQIYSKLEVGSEVDAWVQLVREDGRLDLQLQRRGRAGNDTASQTILDALKRGDGFLPLHDKSPPEAIRDQLQMSKKAFKRALGGLYKQRLIELTPDGIRRID
jgi:hypothetical protein